LASQKTWGTSLSSHVAENACGGQGGVPVKKNREENGVTLERGDDETEPINAKKWEKAEARTGGNQKKRNPLDRKVGGSIRESRRKGEEEKTSDSKEKKLLAKIRKPRECI